MKIKTRTRNSFRLKDNIFNKYSEDLHKYIQFEIVYYGKKSYLNLFCIHLRFDGNPGYYKKHYHLLSREEKLAIPRWLSGIKIKILSRSGYILKIGFAYYQKLNIVFFGSDKDGWPRDKSFTYRLKEYFRIA